ncbi:MAG: hypothetical protein JSU77_07530 [Fidelibacterota bacterium]|nr:MAG: hypothetical protein JSU77_07530 [Candidatus Neomarinimicrobiota bacterium]
MLKQPFVPTIVAAVLIIALSCTSSRDRIMVAMEQTSVTATVTNLRERPSEIYCPCNNIPGRNLVFDLIIANKGKKLQTVYAFVWATNDDLSPPERGIWPISAVDSCLTDRGELSIKDHTTGRKIEVQGQQAVTIAENSILEPIGYQDGKLMSYSELRIQLWSKSGNLEFDETVHLKAPNP